LIADNVLARLYTEAPVNAIWEGSGNVQCLDVLRAMHKEPKSLAAFKAELEKAKGQYLEYDNYLAELSLQLADLSTIEVRARSVIESMAIAWQASTLIQFGEKWLAELFIKARIENPSGLMFGTLPADINFNALIERATPKVDF